jgi:hypothetical protein
MPNVGHFEPFEMRWSPDDLIRLLASRLNRYLAEREMALATPSGEVHWHSPADVRAKVWDKVFPDPAQAPGSSHLEKPEQLILRHTQLRPRQAIRLCNQIAEVWKPTPIPDRPSRRDHYEATPFKPHHITAGIDGRLEHLCTEIVAAYVYIDEHVESALNHFSGGAAVKERMLIEAPESAWTLAYRIGAIGPVKSNSPSYSRSFSYYRAAEFEFCHREPVEWRPSTEEIAVHPLFYRRLGLTESLRTMVYMRGFWSPQPQPVETW